MCKAQHWHCKGNDSDSHRSHPCSSVCIILLLFISPCSLRASPHYVASTALRNSETVLFYLWLSLGHALVWIMEWQQCESKVAARTQKWRGHAQRRSLCVARHLCWAPSCYAGVGRYLFSFMPTLLTLVDKKGEGNRWTPLGSSVDMFCCWYGAISCLLELWQFRIYHIILTICFG